MNDIIWEAVLLVACGFVFYLVLETVMAIFGGG